MISNSRPNPSHPTGASLALLEQFDHKKQPSRRTHVEPMPIWQVQRTVCGEATHGEVK